MNFKFDLERDSIPVQAHMDLGLWGGDQEDRGG